jgi:hypothetical protein
MPKFSGLPAEIIFQILDNLQVKDLIQCGAACSSLHEIAENNHSWIKRCWSRCAGKQFTTAQTEILQNLKAEDYRKPLFIKSIYINQEKESKRTTITSKELQSITWKFNFSDVTSLGDSSDENYFSELIIAKFLPNSIYVSTLYRQSFKYQIDDSGTFVQIGSFPKLLVCRNNEWAFVLMNDYVRLSSTT